MFEKISDNLFKYKNKLFLSWIFLIIIALSSILVLKNSNTDTELTGVTYSEAYKVKIILEKEFGYKVGNSAAIVTDNNKDLTELKNILKNKYKQINKVIEVPSNKKHKNSILYLEFPPENKNIDIQKLTPKIREDLKIWDSKYSTQSFLTGSIAFQYDSKQMSKKDSSKGEFLALIISLIVLLFTFGSPLAAILPLVIGINTLIFLYALLKIFDIPVNPVSQILTGLTGLALATDYSLFLVSRFKEELKTNSDIDSIKNTLKYAGTTIFYSGLIMFFSIFVLIIPDVSITKTVVKNLLLSVFISISTSILFLPIFLLKFKNYLDKPKLFNSISTENFWRSFTKHIIEHPKKYFILSSIILLSLAYPVTQIKLWSPIINIAPSDSESVKGYNLLEKDGWGGEIIPVNVIVKAKNTIYDTKFISFLYELNKEIEKITEVESIQSLTTWNKDFSKDDYINFMNNFQNISLFNTNNPLNNLINTKNGSDKTLVNVSPKNLSDLNYSFNIISKIDEYAKNHKEFDILVGGNVARVNDFTKELYSYIPQMLIFIFTSIYILLFLHTKSLVLPIKAGIMNFLPILSSFGILTLIFQYGYFSSLLNTPINYAVTNIVPIVLFCIIFGLSMDYEVLILSRITEHYEKTEDLKESIIEGLAKSSSLITGAALILTGVFIPGIFSSSPQIKEICIGITTAIFIDATLVRLILVPSFMMLMGKWNWWNPLKTKKG